MSYSALIVLNRAKLAREPQMHACVLCDKQTSIARPVCPTCAKGLD